MTSPVRGSSFFMAFADVTSLLRNHGLRVTPQRQAILQAFRTPGEHLSAEEVSSRASLLVPNIGRGTVYATLAELAELDVLAAVGSSDPVRYETNLAAHDHFRCRLCLRFFDVDLGGDELTARPLKGFSIESVAVVAEGVCSDCGDYRRGLEDGARRCLIAATLPEADLGSMSCAVVDGPLGPLALAATTDGIAHLAFSDHADFAGLAARARSRRGSVAARETLRTWSDALAGYFAGSPAPMRGAIDWRLLDDTRHESLLAVEQIPFGDHRSYDRLDSPLTAYDLGFLMGANPLPLVTPCHRVSRGSELTEWYVGGAGRLHTLRALEQQ